MQQLLILLYLLLAAGLVVMILLQGLTRRVELMSFRNFYLAGFIVYQIISPMKVVMAEGAGMFRLQNANDSGLILFVYALVFLPFYFFAYHKSVVGKWIARRFEVPPKVNSDFSLLLLGFCLVFVGVGARFSTNLPVLRSVAYHFSVGLAVVACALVGWVWSRRRANLGVVIVGLLVLAVAVPLAVHGAYSRRALLGVGMGAAWGAYYGFGNRLRPVTLIAWLTPLVLLAVVLVSAYTSVRGNTRDINHTLTDTIREMASARIFDGVLDVFGGQQCGSAAMWCIENYPSQEEPRHLFSLRQMANQFVPRVWWPNKPKPLANELARIARVDGVNRSAITLTPGVIGYAAAEGGLYAVIAYALFFGGFTRLFDEIVQLNRNEPYTIAACGVAMGHMLGIARGDLANFTVNITVTFIATYVCIWLMRKMLGKPIEQQVVYWQLASPAPPTQPRMD